MLFATMRIFKNILLFQIFLVIPLSSILCQNSVLHAELSIFPLCYKQKKEIRKDYINYTLNADAGPTLLLAFPISKRINLISGIFPISVSSKKTYNDSIRWDPTSSTWLTMENCGKQGLYGYVSEFNDKHFGLYIPMIIEYNIFTYNNISINIAGGSLGLLGKSYYYVEYNFYSIGDTINFVPYRDIYKENYLLINSDIILTGSLEYFPFKHFGFSIRPYFTYSLFESKGSKLFGCALGFGICYK